MRAMVLPRFGGPDLFEQRELERPSPGPGEVFVRVGATAVNPVDAKLRADGGWAGLRPPAARLPSRACACACCALRRRGPKTCSRPTATSSPRPRTSRPWPG